MADYTQQNRITFFVTMSIALAMILVAFLLPIVRIEVDAKTSTILFVLAGFVVVFVLGMFAGIPFGYRMRKNDEEKEEQE